MSQCSSSAKLLQACSRIRQRPTSNSLVLSATRVSYHCSWIERSAFASRNVRNFSTDGDQEHYLQDIADILRGSEPRAPLSLEGGQEECVPFLDASNSSKAPPKRDDHVVTMNIIRASTSQHVHAMVNEQPARLRDNWVRKQKQLRWELEHPEPRDRADHATRVATLSVREDSNKQMERTASEEIPSLMDFLESTPNTRRSSDGASRQAQLATSMERASIPPERNHSSAPSLMDLLNDPVTAAPSGTSSLRDLLDEPVVQSRMPRADEHTTTTLYRHGQSHTLSLMDLLEAPMPSLEEATRRQEPSNPSYRHAPTSSRMNFLERPIMPPGAPADARQSSAPSLRDLLNSEPAASRDEVPSLMDLLNDEPIAQSARATSVSDQYSATTSLMDLLEQPGPLLEEATRHASPNPSPQNEMLLPFADPLKKPTLADMTQHGPSLMDLLNKEQPTATETPEKLPSLMDLLNASSPIAQSTRETSPLPVMSETVSGGTTNQPSLMDLLVSSSSERAASRTASTFDSTALHCQLTTNAVVSEGLALLSVMGGADWTTSDWATSDQSGCNRSIQSDQDIEKSELLIQDVLDGGRSLSTEDSNMLMLHLGTSPIYESTDAIEKMKELHEILTKHGIADSWTHYILLATCSQRCPGLSTAVDIVESLALGSSLQWTERLIIQAMVCLEQHGRIALAEKLLRKLESDSIRIPAKASISMIRLYQTENMQTAAMTIVNKYVETMRSSKETNKILEQAVKWPPKLRKSNGVNRLPIFKDLLYSVSKVLKRENRGEGTISVGFWQRLLTDMWGEVPLAEKQTIAGAVKEGFRLFREDHPNSNHNGDLFTTGLEVAGLTRDSGLAKDLLFKYVDAKVALADNKGDSGIADKLPTVNDIAFVGDEAELTSPGIDNDQFGSILGSSDKDLNLYLPSSVKVRPPSISQSAVSKVLEIALSAQDVDSVQEILSAFEGSLSSMPVSSKNTLYSLGVKGIARIGEPDDALCLLNNMYANGLSPCEVTCGAVIYCLAHANRVTEANSLFDDVSEGKFGKNIMPGLACFNAHMLSLMKMKNWEDVVRLQQTMKEAGISPDATTFQGVLIASTKHGDDNAVLGVVEDALKNGWKMNRECIDLTMRILLKDLNLPTNSTPATRDKLRMLIDQRGELQNEYLDLLRTLRTAEVEDSREGPKFVRLEDIRVRQETAWRAVLESLITLSKKKSRSCNESVLKRSI